MVTDMKVGILTGGGDCPGLNAAIRAAVINAEKHGIEMVGIRKGWAGLLNAWGFPLGPNDVECMLKEGGTMLGSSRTNPYKTEGGEAQAREGFVKLGLDALIAIGGEDTLGVANKLSKAGMPTVAIPKTIDKDLSATDSTIGFNTAVTVATDAIDRVFTTMRSHERVGVVEIMGRHAGWMAYIAGIAGGANVILIPEEPFDIDEVCQVFVKRKERGKPYGVVAIAEGAMPKDAQEFVTSTDELDDFGHVRLGGIGKKLAKEIEKRTGIESRATVLGHIQRGGSPTVYDRVMGTKLGYKAIEMVVNREFGKLVAYRNEQAVAVPLEEAVGKLNTVSAEEYEMVKTFFR